VNDDEIGGLLDFARARRAEIRFIEYMDVGGATHWTPDAVVTRREILEAVERHAGPAEPVAESSWAPADRYRLGDGTVFGVISSTTQPFCDTCDRSRLTADGVWLLCLYATGGIDLRRLLRQGAPADEVRALVARTWQARTDRGAVERLGANRRAAFIPLASLKRDAHLEMHTRGG
jgi:cyclic pyranopterin phosphate synthase